ncbi:hypothetical protein TFUB4_01661 [Tannerella forsythia]|nr:hypothetical protein TFUB4_01661 [Tannerella forsythia]
MSPKMLSIEQKYNLFINQCSFDEFFEPYPQRKSIEKIVIG